MNDHLALSGIALRSHIGVTAAERKRPQRLLVSLLLETDASAVAAADDPSAGVDYAAVIEGIRKLGRTERKTIERLAEDIAAYLLQHFPVPSASVTVTKKPPIKDVGGASVTIVRRKEVSYRRGPLIA